MSSALIGGLNPAFRAKQHTASQTTLSATATVSATPGTFGSWAQVTASSAADYYVTGMSVMKVGGNAAAASHALVAVGFGGSGSETTLGVATIAGAAADIVGGEAQFLAPLRIASGQRIAIRASSSPNSDAVPPQLLVYLWLVPYSSIEGN